jgi:hypothetical protein
MAQGVAPAAVFSRASTNRLTHHDLGRFDGTSLLAKLGRAVCEAGCLPRKELFEAWEMARRVRRRFRGGRVVDFAGGHGLLAHAMLLLDDSSPSAVVVDPAVPPSALRLHESMADVWPRLRHRVTFEANPAAVTFRADDLIVSCHACGALTDRVLDMATRGRARVAVLPCCHDLRGAPAMLAGWIDPALAQDVDRAQRLAGAGYDVWTLNIPADITPKNRLLLGQHAQNASRPAVCGKPA